MVKQVCLIVDGVTSGIRGDVVSMYFVIYKINTHRMHNYVKSSILIHRVFIEVGMNLFTEVGENIFI